jgi:hypothetical protein
MAYTYVPRQQFVAFHARRERWALIVAHRRFGKTVGCLQEAIGRALHTEKPNSRYVYLAPYREQAKRVAFDYLLRFTEGKRVSASIADLSVTLPGDRKIFLAGADNADNLRGQYFDGIIIDEPGNMRPSVFTEVIRPALADRRGWAVFIGTPNGKNEFWEFNEIARKSEGGEDGWFYLNLKASETGILPQSELDDARAVMSEDEYAQEFENDFGAAIKGSIYGKMIREMETNGQIGDVPYATGVPVHTCWDLGFADACVVWFFQVIDRTPCFFDSYAAHGSSVDEVARMMKDKREEYEFTPGYNYLPHDAFANTFQTGRSTVEQLFRHGIRSRAVPSLTVQDGIQATRLMLRTARFDASSCERGLEALRQYQHEWDEKKQVFKQKPLHDWTSDYADALRIGALGYREDYSPPGVYIPESRRPRPLLSNGVQLAELWKTIPARRQGAPRI